GGRGGREPAGVDAQLPRPRNLPLAPRGAADGARVLVGARPRPHHPRSLRDRRRFVRLLPGTEGRARALAGRDHRALSRRSAPPALAAFAAGFPLRTPATPASASR